MSNPHPPEPSGDRMGEVVLWILALVLLWGFAAGRLLPERRRAEDMEQQVRAAEHELEDLRSETARVEGVLRGLRDRDPATVEAQIRRVLHRAAPGERPAPTDVEPADAEPPIPADDPAPPPQDPVPADG